MPVSRPYKDMQHKAQASVTGLGSDSFSPHIGFTLGSRYLSILVLHDAPGEHRKQ